MNIAPNGGNPCRLNYDKQMDGMGYPYPSFRSSALGYLSEMAMKRERERERKREREIESFRHLKMGRKNA